MEYTWLPSNNLIFNKTYDNFDEMLKTAQNEWNNKSGEYYSNNNEDNNSPIINVGEVEHFQIENYINNDLGDDLIDRLEETINDFAFGTDCEGELFIKDKEEFKRKYQDFLKKLVNEHCSFYPSMKMHTYEKQYDLSENVI